MQKYAKMLQNSYVVWCLASYIHYMTAATHHLTNIHLCAHNIHVWGQCHRVGMPQGRGGSRQGIYSNPFLPNGFDVA